jgi:hypothetical protein
LRTNDIAKLGRPDLNLYRLTGELFIELNGGA